MGWETRGNNSYYYRKRREGRRVVSEYVSSMFSPLMAMLDEEQQAEHAQRRLAERLEREKMQAANAAIEQVGDLADTMVIAVLIAEGYHYHKGQWRKMRHDRPNRSQV